MGAPAPEGPPLLAIDGAVAGIAALADTLRPESAEAIATLRQWKIDATGVNVTNGNNNNVTQQTIDRLGIFFGHFADLLSTSAAGLAEFHSHRVAIGGVACGILGNENIGITA